MGKRNVTGGRRLLTRMIRFTSVDHQYSSLDTTQAIDWIGISHLIGAFEPPFNSTSAAVKCSRNPKSKWYGIDPIEIKSIWNKESDRSLNMGHWYHNKEEDSITSSPTYQYNGATLNVAKPIVIDGVKYSPPQKLEDNHIYPEHLVYLQSEGICGQSDIVKVSDLRVSIVDHKTYKTVKEQGFRNWEGITQRMLDPLSHLDHCNFVHASLQMSLYLYMILKHNPHLKPGTLTLNHIIFEQESEDKYGYPIYKTESNGDFIVKEIRPYNIAYLKTEVLSLLSYLKDNRELVKSKINEKQD